MHRWILPIAAVAVWVVLGPPTINAFGLYGPGVETLTAIVAIAIYLGVWSWEGRLTGESPRQRRAREHGMVRPPSTPPTIDREFLRLLAQDSYEHVTPADEEEWNAKDREAVSAWEAQWDAYLARNPGMAESELPRMVAWRRRHRDSGVS